jgi:hypothetical protein
MTRDVCLQDPLLLVILVAANLVIFLSYMAIPAAILWVALRSKNLPFPALWVLFGVFIVGCGLTHLVGALVFFRQAWHLEAAVCVLTAIVSASTAALLWVWRRAVLAALHDYDALASEMAQIRDARTR